MAVKPSPVQFIAVRNMSGSPPDKAIHVAMKLALTGSSSPNIEENNVAAHRDVPMPAGRPGAAIVNKTRAGQAMNNIVQLISK